MIPANELSLLIQTACIWEATSRKLGNVTRQYDFADTSLTDFLISAAVAGQSLSKVDTVGKMVERAIEATSQAVKQNTNLGIVLAIAPLAACDPGQKLADGIKSVLANLTVEDSVHVYSAIRKASPGGLGQVDQQDVKDEPTFTLLEAMKLAVSRDQIAREYTIDFQTLFTNWLPYFEQSYRHFKCIEPAILELQIKILSEEPDTLIARKNGVTVAKEICELFQKLRDAGGIRTIEGRSMGKTVNQYLRSSGNRLNPGTTADLIAAVLFAALRERIVTVDARFPWTGEWT